MLRAECEVYIGEHDHDGPMLAVTDRNPRAEAGPLGGGAH